MFENYSQCASIKYHLKFNETRDTFFDCFLLSLFPHPMGVWLKLCFSVKKVYFSLGCGSFELRNDSTNYMDIIRYWTKVDVWAYSSNSDQRLTRYSGNIIRKEARSTHSISITGNQLPSRGIWFTYTIIWNHFQNLNEKDATIIGDKSKAINIKRTKF